MYAGRVACCSLVSHGQHADGIDRQTDGRTPDRYVTLYAKGSQRTGYSPKTTHVAGSKSNFARSFKCHQNRFLDVEVEICPARCFGNWHGQ